MSLVDDIQGKRFGRLVVVGVTKRFLGKNKQPIRWAVCDCDCGGATEAAPCNLKSGHTTSCSCYSRQRASEANSTHGRRHTPTYEVWVGIKKRCYSKKFKQYADYGGRGIKMADCWVDSAETFMDWAESHGYKLGLQIDRRDNDGDYSPENCRFVSRSVNVANCRLIRQANTSGFRGVSLHKHNDAYSAYASFNKERVLFKSGFPTAVAAAMFRDAVCLQKRLPMPLNFPAMTDNDAELIIKEVNDNGPRGCCFGRLQLSFQVAQLSAGGGKPDC